MGNFLRENWIWIATPVVLLVIAIVMMMFIASGSSDDGQFIYNIF